MATLSPAHSGSRLNKGQRTANRILDVAEAQFAKAGYHATSLRDIAAEAGIQQPGLYKHFAGKEDLYRRVYERALRPLFALMDGILEGPADMPGLDALAGRMTDLLAQHPNIGQLLVRAMIGRDGEFDAIAAEWIDLLVGYGRRISAKAGFADDGDALAVQVLGIFNVLFGYFWAAPLIASLTGKPANDPRLLDLQKRMLTGFVESLG